MMMITENVCARPGCEAHIEGFQLACRTHWFDLPTSLRNRIWRHHRSGNTGAHHQAVVEALAVWDPPPPPPVRCHVCRIQTDLIEAETNQPVCLTCAKISIGSGMPIDEPCSRCGRTSVVLVSLDEQDPHLCFDCISQLVTLDEGRP